MDPAAPGGPDRSGAVRAGREHGGGAGDQRGVVAPGYSPVLQSVAYEALDLLNIDPRGLDEIVRRVLRAIIEKYHGGPVGLSTIGASISEEPDTIMDVVEPYLLQLGFLERTSQGRVATAAAYQHLGMEAPKNIQQPRLL